MLVTHQDVNSTKTRSDGMFGDVQTALSESVCASAQSFEQVAAVLLSHCVWCVSGCYQSEPRDTSAVPL